MGIMIVVYEKWLLKGGDLINTNEIMQQCRKYMEMYTGMSGAAARTGEEKEKESIEILDIQ